MKISDFDFHLPPNLIAQEPYNPRDGAKLLSVGSTLEDKLITDLLEILSAGDMLVFNDTKVIPCRLNGQQNNLTLKLPFTNLYQAMNGLHSQNPPENSK